MSFINEMANFEKPARARPHGKQEYKGNGKHEWEWTADDKDEGFYTTERLRVPGGWLYRDDRASGMTFVPVPNVVGYAV